MSQCPTLTLRSGDRIPQIGLGMWKVDGARVSSLVEEAVRTGYRHLDCACDYGNELEVGRGLRSVLAAGDCKREDLWLTSKLWNTFHRAEHVPTAAQRSLKDLGVEYLDLYLIHFPISLRFVDPAVRYPPGWFFDPDAEHPRMVEDLVPLAETWQAMESLVTSGLVRNIGICNFPIALIRDLLSYASIPPAVLQVESHPFLTQEKLLRFCQEQQIVYTAFSPLGARSYLSLGMAQENEDLLSHPLLLEIAQKVQRTPAQVALRWAIQRGTAVIPKTASQARLSENLDLFSFELTTDQMKAIAELDQGRRFNDPGVFCQSAFHTFYPIYE